MRTFLTRRLLHTERVNPKQLEALDCALNQLEQQNLKVKFSDSYAALIRQCADSGSIFLARRLQNLVVASGYGENSYLAGLLVHMFVKCGDLAAAQAVFDLIPSKKSIVWNVLIGEYDRLGHSRRALELFHKMDCEPDKVTYLLALRICAGLRELEQGKGVQERILRSPFSGDVKLQNGAVSMFSKCGRLDLAMEMFDQMRERDVVSWNSAITAYTQFGKPLQAMLLYRRMLLEGSRPSEVTFSAVISACRTREEARSIQEVVKSSEFWSEVVAQNSLVSAYARCGDLESARGVFDDIQRKDIVSWNSIISAYSQQGWAQETLELYEQMNVEPDSITFASALGACALLSAFRVGKRIHEQVLQSRFRAEPIVETALIHMYSKCNLVEEAEKVFQGIDQRRTNDPSSLNAMMSGNVQHGKPREALALFERAEFPDKVTFLSALGACSVLEDVNEGVKVHKRALECGLESDIVVQTSLFNMYSKCRRLDVARELFDKMEGKTVVAWNVMISAYAQAEDRLLNRKALELYGMMDSEGIQPDEVTFSNLLCACVSLGALEDARAIHSRVSASKCKESRVLNTAIVTMYAKFNMLDHSRSVFDGMEVKCVTAWNAMISAYAQHGLSRKALHLYHRMILEGMKPDSRTFISVLGACSGLQDLFRGKQIELQAASGGFDVKTALLGLYAKCGELGAAREMFERLQRRTVVTWNTMIAAYAQLGFGSEALGLFQRMEGEGILPDEISYAAALGACPSSGGARTGAWIHEKIRKRGLRGDVFLETAIVSMYGKCGELETARGLFEEMANKNVVTWSAMVGAYILHGYEKEALELYLRMDAEGFQPSDVTLTEVLGACASTGALKEGRAIHARIRSSSSFRSNMFLQNAVLNMYAKCGCLAIARSLFVELQRRDTFSWNTIIVAHAHHGDFVEVLDLQQEMVLDGARPDYVTLSCVLLACSHAGFVDRGRGYFVSMKMDFGVDYDSEHFVCMVDALARAGKIHAAEELISSMPFEPPALAWTSLLGSSQVQSDLDRGVYYAENAAELRPECSSSYVLLWNIYNRSKIQARTAV